MCVRMLPKDVGYIFYFVVLALCSSILSLTQVPVIFCASRAAAL